ncbi:MAG: hypothetical protein ABW252_24560 [Polyangiales bacterium]
MDLLMRRVAVTLCAALAVSCVPDLDSDASRVSAPRVLAIRAEPAEAAPNQAVQYSALVADQSGERRDASLTWFYCTAQKPLAELGPVSPKCLRVDSGQLSTIGQGPMVQGTLPREACALFGPNPPPPVEDQPPGRPVDPDETGGYKLPVVLGANAGAGDSVVLYDQRITCGLSGVPPQLSVEFATRYHRNQNPAPSELRVLEPSGATRVVALGQPLEVAAGAGVTLEAAWPACPASDTCGDGVCGPDETVQGCGQDCATQRGCDGQERFVALDRGTGTLVVRREAMRLAWYATRGGYDEERTGVADDAAAPASRNTWTAPSEPGPATLWVVLRDARGGVGFREQAVIVR